MSVKVSNTENKNEVKLEFTVEAKIFDEGITDVNTISLRFMAAPFIFIDTGSNYNRKI